MVDLRYYPKQGQFLFADEHHAAFVAGIGSGKSIAGAMRALLASQGYVGQAKVIQTPNLGVVTAPTYTMLSDATLRAFMEIAGGAVKSFNKNERLATMANGSEIIFRSTEHPERLRGPSISWWWGDEAALYVPNVWPIMVGRLRQFGKYGYAWVTTTPKGRNWIWKQFASKTLTPDPSAGASGRGVETGTGDYVLVQASSADNPFLDEAIITAWRETYAGDFARQELGGEFVAFEGLIYAEFDRGTHVVTQRPQDFVQVVAGVDWGYTNPGVMVIFGVDGDGRMWGLHEEYRRQRRIEEWANVAAELRDTYRVTRWFCDPSEPSYIRALVEAGCKAEAADNRVTAGIQAVKNRLVRRGDGRARLVLSPDFVQAAAEFEQYQWRGQRGGGFADEPVKANDHVMDAIRYAVMGAEAGLKRGRVTVSADRYA